MRAANDSLTGSEREVLDAIEASGMHVEHVPESNGEPGYSYSVGLWHSFQQPEVVVFGLPAEVAQDLLEAIADDAAEGVQFVADSRHEGLLQGYPVRFFAVPKACYARFLGVARWAHEGDHFPAVQLVWPDKQGRWPWDEGVREGFRDGQPVLARLEPPA